MRKKQNPDESQSIPLASYADVFVAAAPAPLCEILICAEFVFEN